MIAYQADWVCPATAAPIRHGIVVVEGARLVSVAEGDLPEGAERIVYPGCAILPGFVNTHTHLELTLFHGLLENLSFSDWIGKLTRTKYERCTRDALKLSAQLGAHEMLQAGVTAIGEVMDIPTGWEAMRESGLQGVAYQEVFGPAEAAADEALRGLREKVELSRKTETDTQRIGVSPHAPFTVSEKLYEGVRDYARHAGLRMTAHIAESPGETRFVRDGTGPFAENHRKRGIPVLARGCSPIAYLDRLGLLAPDMLLVHAIELETGDLERIRESGACVAHCPRSNAFLKHRIAPVAAMREHGIPVSLGTDSVASNDAFDMFAEMRAVIEQQGLPGDEVFRMATIEGAKALGLDEHLGSLEAGKRADFCVVGLKDPGVDPLDKLIRFGRSEDVRKRFIGGREVVVETDGLRAEVVRLQKELREAIG